MTLWFPCQVCHFDLASALWHHKIVNLNRFKLNHIYSRAENTCTRVSVSTVVSTDKNNSEYQNRHITKFLFVLMCYVFFNILNQRNLFVTENLLLIATTSVAMRKLENYKRETNLLSVVWQVLLVVTVSVVAVAACLDQHRWRHQEQHGEQCHFSHVVAEQVVVELTRLAWSGGL